MSEMEFQWGGEDLLADRRRPGELEILAHARQCFKDAPSRWNTPTANDHCFPGTKPDHWYWEVQMPGDGIMINGQVIPTHSKWTPCSEHLPSFEHVFREIRICPSCGVNELPPRCRKCEACVG